MTTVASDQAALEYWYARVAIGDEAECWPWIGNISPRGYGFARGTTASRFTWMLFNGEIPNPKLHVCHECDNPPCVNPGHLFLGSARENIRDSIQKGRRRSIADPRICPRGHRVEGDNVYWYRGQRQCCACRNIHLKTYYDSKRKDIVCPDCGETRNVSTLKSGARCVACANRRNGLIRRGESV